MGQDCRTTYYERLGWAMEATGCKGCGDPESHKHPGWATKQCKPVMIPDQWQAMGYSKDYKPIPNHIPDEDIVLMKPWDEREELKNYPPETKEEWEEHDRIVAAREDDR